MYQQKVAITYDFFYVYLSHSFVKIYLSFFIYKILKMYRLYYTCLNKITITHKALYNLIGITNDIDL